MHRSEFVQALMDNRLSNSDYKCIVENYGSALVDKLLDKPIEAIDRKELKESLILLYQCGCLEEIVFQARRDRLIVVLISIYAYYVQDFDIRQIVLALIIESMDYSQDLILLLINTIQRDLFSESVDIVCFSLKAIVNLRLPSDIYHHFIPRLIELCNHSNNHLRKHVIMTLIHIDKVASTVDLDSFESILKNSLVQTDLELLQSTLNLLFHVTKRDLSVGYRYLKAAAHILNQIIALKDNQWMYHGTALPWCQIKLLKYYKCLLDSSKLSDSDRKSIFSSVHKCFEKSTQGVDAAFAVLETALEIMLHISKLNDEHVKITTKACEIIRQFSNSENSNMRYIGGKMLQSVTKWQPSFCIMFKKEVIYLIDAGKGDDTCKILASEVLLNMLNSENCERVVAQVLEFVSSIISSNEESCHKILARLHERFQNLDGHEQFKFRTALHALMKYHTHLSSDLQHQFSEYLIGLIEITGSCDRIIVELLSTMKTEWPKFSQNHVSHLLSLLAKMLNLSEINQEIEDIKSLGDFLMDIIKLANCSVENFVQAIDALMLLVKTLELRNVCRHQISDFIVDFNLSSHDYVKSMALARAKKHIRDCSIDQYIPFKDQLDQSSQEVSQIQADGKENQKVNILNVEHRIRYLKLEPYPAPLQTTARKTKNVQIPETLEHPNPTLNISNQELFKGFM